MGFPESVLFNRLQFRLEENDIWNILRVGRSFFLGEGMLFSEIFNAATKAGMQRSAYSIFFTMATRLKVELRP